MLVKGANGRFSIRPMWPCSWAQNLSNPIPLESRFCGTPTSGTTGWIYFASSKVIWNGLDVLCNIISICSICMIWTCPRAKNLSNLVHFAECISLKPLGRPVWASPCLPLRPIWVCPSAGIHIYEIAGYIFSARSPMESSLPAGVQRHGHLSIWPKGACSWVRMHISEIYLINSLQSSLEFARPVVMQRHLPHMGLPWAKNLINLVPLGSTLCGTHVWHR